MRALLDAAAQQAIDAGACPGIALRIAINGATLLSANYGKANLETSSAVDEDSVFRIGSLSKQFTAALTLKLASQAQLALDAPVSRYLDFFAAAKPFTLRELLNHTAGLHDDIQDVSCPAGTEGAKSQIALAHQISAQGRLLDFDPGTAWHYSNANYIVVGAVIEQVTGLALADAAREHLFKPLGLQHTAFDTTTVLVPGRVDGYSPIDGLAGTYSRAAFIEISDTGGAGAMRSTTSDLCRWHHALFAQQLFGNDFLGQMIEPGRLRDGRLSGTQRFSREEDSYGDVQYGMGLLLPAATGTQRSVLHYGYINGFSACLETYIDVGMSCAILCNGDIGPNLPLRALRRIVATRLLPTLR
ncbi:serine hydrolase domain-containing protein [Xanthomonas hortorum]|uniref:serine hydrolase domain-containing protein n=1 Tax=Xanthomonas hortorum TaxID=56454 RepID=UPI0029356720|nr:serine hydrolase domain-containing protein [Xanthomonas hortorum]MDV2449413.1 serine hydrolase domain-containing protein [Xanthomonas hortorum NBC5720]